MTVIDRVQAELAGLSKSLKALPGNLLSETRSEFAARSKPATNGPVSEADDGLISKAMGAVNSTEVLGRINRADAGNFSQKAAQKPAAPAQPAQWTKAPLWGNLTADQYHDLFRESAMTPKSWKNLWFVRITDRKHSDESPKGIPILNLLAVDASFGPKTLTGEAVAFGSVNMDHLTGTERTDLRLTTLDDSRGLIKRWFAAKCDQAAHDDGTFGMPADYLVTVEITHMAPLNGGTIREHLHHKWLMRPVAMDIELSRRSHELEELQLSFTQFDTFMRP